MTNSNFLKSKGPQLVIISCLEKRNKSISNKETYLHINFWPWSVKLEKNGNSVSRVLKWTNFTSRKWVCQKDLGVLSCIFQRNYPFPAPVCLICVFDRKNTVSLSKNWFYPNISHKNWHFFQNLIQKKSRDMVAIFPAMILTATILLSIIAPHLAVMMCRTGSIELPAMGVPACFALYLDAGKIDRDGAQDHCDKHFMDATLVYVDTKVG